ncbi:hypothetical protein DNTS_005128 [Danionella cerebrum]|uniref:Heme-binding protein 1 n=1 Tax=Danionella cerebrum TaxID=2873325 RepID=A0A553QKP0_9TELE|nr:hypothetical protein DNTS_005128 [Danionella translucida]
MLIVFERIWATGAIVVLFAATVTGRIGEHSFCSETKECLLFDVVCAGSDYEVRHYDAAKWVTTEVESMFRDVAVTRAFRKLFKYITGENEAGAKIEMTAPVITKVKEGSNMWDTSVYVLSFLLPSDFQAQPPKPTDPSVYLTELPDMNVYVKSFGGWMISMVATRQTQSLKTALDKAQATYETDYHYEVGYNSPMKILNRHNEVWYIVKGQPVCPTGE